MIRQRSCSGCYKGVRMKDRLTSEVHGGDIYRNRHVRIDFSVNTNPLGPPHELTEAVRSKAEQISHYPDMHCVELTEALGRFENVPMEYLLCGNGAAELFYSAVLAVKPKKALLLSPTFSEYERALKLLNTDIFYYELREEEQFQVREDILYYIMRDVDMVFLCNPNNPTGQAIPKDLLECIAKRCKEQGSFLVIDECFVDFLEHPELYEMKGELSGFPKILIVKALTKLFCMPGLRMGYGMCSDRRLLRRMRAALQSWNVSALAQAGGIAAVKDCADYLEETERLIRRERSFLADELKKLKFQVCGSHANYIFFKDFLSNERDLYDEALAAGFLIRDCSDYRGLFKGYYRIAVRTRAENERMITWLRQL